MLKIVTLLERVCYLLMAISLENAVSQKLPTDFTNNIYFNIYKGLGSYDVVTFNSGPSAIQQLPQFVPMWQTIFYYPGWGEDPTTVESVRLISDAIMQKGSLNLIVADYSRLIRSGALTEYAGSFINSSRIGRCLGKYLKDYSTSVQDSQFIRIVSHSMGSQIMSYAAKTFGSGILRLTALDPAYPLYAFPSPHLTKHDASFLDVIHTDSANYGYPDSIGTVDFFPNNGARIQPYCKVNNSEGDFCSHHMSWRYFAESVNNEKVFPARGCSVRRMCVVYPDQTVCKCTSFNKDVSYMGYGVDTRSAGNFYLRTSNSSPFGLGLDGM